MGIYVEVSIEVGQVGVAVLLRPRRLTVIRVFVASTFRDFHAERGILSTVQAAVNDRLRLDALEVVFVDLRWGLYSGDESEIDPAAFESIRRRCLDDISRCDAFVAFLGPRYGVTQEQAPILGAARAGSGPSITELEVRAALDRREDTSGSRMSSARREFPCTFFFFDGPRQSIDLRQRELREYVLASAASDVRTVDRRSAGYLELFAEQFVDEVMKLVRSAAPLRETDPGPAEPGVLALLSPDALASAAGLVNLDGWIDTHKRRELCLRVTADDEHVAAAVMFEYADRQRNEGSFVLVYSTRLQRPCLVDCLAEFIQSLPGTPGPAERTLQSLLGEFRAALGAVSGTCFIYIDRADLFWELEGRSASCWLQPLPGNVTFVYSSASVPSSATNVSLSVPDREDAEAFVIRQAHRYGKALSPELIEALVTRQLGHTVQMSATVTYESDEPRSPKPREPLREPVLAFERPRWLELATSVLLASDRDDIAELAAIPAGASQQKRLLAWISALPSDPSRLLDMKAGRASAAASPLITGTMLALLLECRHGIRFAVLNNWVRQLTGLPVPAGQLQAAARQFGSLIRVREDEDGEHWQLVSDLLEHYADEQVALQSKDSAASRNVMRSFIARGLFLLGPERNFGNKLDCLRCALEVQGIDLAARVILEKLTPETGHALASVITATVIPRNSSDLAAAYELAEGLLSSARNQEAADAMAYFLTVYVFRRMDEKWRRHESEQNILAQLQARLASDLQAAGSPVPNGNLMASAAAVSIRLHWLALEIGACRSWSESPLPPKAVEASPEPMMIAYARLLDARLRLCSADTASCHQSAVRALSALADEATREDAPGLWELSGHFVRISGGTLPDGIPFIPVPAGEATGGVEFSRLGLLRELVAAGAFSAEQDFRRAQSHMDAAFAAARDGIFRLPDSGDIGLLYQFTHLLQGDLLCDQLEIWDALDQYADAEECLRLIGYQAISTQQIILLVCAALRLAYASLLHSDIRRARKALANASVGIRFGMEIGMAKKLLAGLNDRMPGLRAHAEREFAARNVLSDDEWNTRGVKVTRSRNMYSKMYRSFPGDTEWREPSARALRDFAAWCLDSGEHGQALTNLMWSAQHLEKLGPEEAALQGLEATAEIVDRSPMAAMYGFAEDGRMLSDRIAALIRSHVQHRRAEVDQLIDIRSIRLASWSCVLDPTAVFLDLLEEETRQAWVPPLDRDDELITRTRLANQLDQGEDPAEVVEAVRETLEARLTQLGHDHPDTLTARHELAMQQGDAGDAVAAVAELKALLADQLRVLGPEHPGTLTTRHDLAIQRGEAGDAAAAIEELQELSADYLRLLGPDHPGTLNTRASLACWHGEVGEVAAAAEQLEAVLADQLRVLGADHPDTLSTRSNLASARGNLGDAAGAVTALEEVLEDHLRIQGPGYRPSLLATISNLAYWRREAGDPAGAAESFRLLLAAQLRFVGADHPDILAIRHNLASCRGESGDVTGAVEDLEALLADELRILGRDHPDTLGVWGTLAYFKGHAGDIKAAIEALQALADDQVRILGPDHPDALTTRHNIADWRGKAGDISGAAEALEGLLTDQVRVFGPDHPDTLGTRGNLASLLGEAGDPVSAAAEYEALLADQIRVLGPDHPRTLSTRANIAFWRGEAGDTAAAAGAYEALLADELRVQGTDHPSTLTTRSNLASLQGEAGDATGAQAAFESLLADRLRVLGPDHPDTLITRGNLAFWQGQAGDPGGAVVEYEALLADELRILGPDHPDTLTTLDNLASSRGEAGDRAGAVTALKELLANMLRVLGPDHPDTLITRGNLAFWQGQAGDPGGAVVEYEALLADELRILGPDHPTTLTTRANLADWRGEAGDPAGAAAAFEVLLADQTRILGADHPDTLTTRADLADRLGEMGHEADAAQMLEGILSDRLRVLGVSHPDTLVTREALAYWQSEADKPQG
jgi:tetratricopeptide (TPR) repeat protein